MHDTGYDITDFSAISPYFSHMWDHQSNMYSCHLYSVQARGPCLPRMAGAAAPEAATTLLTLCSTQGAHIHT